MNYFSGQTVTSTNALVAQQTYSDPLKSVHGSASLRRMYELENSTPPYSTHTYNMPSVPPRNTMPHIGPIADEMFDRYMQRWQNRQQSARPTQQTGQTGSPPPVRPVVSIDQTGSPGHATSNQQTVSTSTQPNSSINLEKFLAECKNDLAKMIKESLGLEIKGKTLSYQKPYPMYFDTVTYPTGFRLPEFVKFSGDDSKSTFEHVSKYLAQLEEASSINELKVHLFSLSLIGTAFSSFSSLAPNSITSWEQLEQKFHDHFFSKSYELKLSHLRASPRVCHILLGISCVLSTSKKICQVKKEFISNSLA